FLAGGAGNDYLNGGLSNDSLFGGTGNDTLAGDDGDDNLHGDDGADFLTGGIGNDTLQGGIGDDNLYGDDGADNLYGEDGADSLAGGVGNDGLTGNFGNDVLIGGVGKDNLAGNEGDDILIGGSTEYDNDLTKLRAISAAWSAAAPYATRIQQITDELFTAHLASVESVFDDQVSDTVNGGGDLDWFFETGYMALYLPSDVESPHQADVTDGTNFCPCGDGHTMVIVGQPPALDGFALIDSLDNLSDRQTSETITSLVPHADSPSLLREHLSLFQLVRYDQVTNYAIRSGAWSDPTTWHGGVVPVAGARVLIPVGVNVQVDGMIAARLAAVRVDGTLSFNATRNTQLKVDTAVVSDAGTFEMGTASSPIANGVTARLLITDNGAIDRTWDPFGISRGLIAQGSVSIFGAQVDSYAALANPALVGTQTLTLKTIPVGWKVGDSVVLAATSPGATQNESRQILAIVENIVTLDRPLIYNHVSPSIDLDVHLANVTRNAVIESETSTIDRRGHVMFMHNRDVNIGYAGFYRLGRTDKLKPINDSVVQSDWTLKPGTGTNQRARYAVHFHRNGLTDDSDPSVIFGSAVVDSPGWGFVNHSSNVDMIGNVAFDVHGAAFTTEVGDEIGGFYANLAIGATGSTDSIDARIAVQDFGFQGDGFWFQGAGVSVVGNISAGNQESAFDYYTRGLIEGGVQQQFLAANLADPSIAQGADKIAVGLVPVRQFSDNVGYASHTGLLIRYHLEGATPGANSIFDNSKFWNNEVGVNMPYTQHTALRNLTVISGMTPKPYVAIKGNIDSQNDTYENLTVAGYHIGIELPRQGTNVVNGGTFSNNSTDILIYTAALSDRTTFITAVPAQTKVTTYIDTNGFGLPVNIFLVKDVIVLNFGTFAYQRLYFAEQQANAIPFPVARPDAPAAYIGLTNQQLWDQFGVALGGAIAPANAFTAPNINGLVAPPGSG
ncbi:MAG: G8 domain-containing protein, partial [Pirellulales bacterium]